MVFVRAQVGPPNYGAPKGKFSVHYFDEKGNMTIVVHPKNGHAYLRPEFGSKPFEKIV